MPQKSSWTQREVVNACRAFKEVSQGAEVCTEELHRFVKQSYEKHIELSKSDSEDNAKLPAFPALIPDRDGKSIWEKAKEARRTFSRVHNVVVRKVLSPDGSIPTGKQLEDVLDDLKPLLYQKFEEEKRADKENRIKRNEANGVDQIVAVPFKDCIVFGPGIDNSKQEDCLSFFDPDTLFFGKISNVKKTTREYSVTWSADAKCNLNLLCSDQHVSATLKPSFMSDDLFSIYTNNAKENEGRIPQQFKEEAGSTAKARQKSTSALINIPSDFSFDQFFYAWLFFGPLGQNDQVFCGHCSLTSGPTDRPRTQGSVLNRAQQRAAKLDDQHEHRAKKAKLTEDHNNDMVEIIKVSKESNALFAKSLQLNMEKKQLAERTAEIAEKKMLIELATSPNSKHLAQKELLDLF
mmetsp:Transcript_17945/g.23378  ORF Transcript_17945/g.23378 Transcript_17945/m.23378 type:complete len:407 (+) Transcript_17945:74-1294(+)|eukprot:CAMPEP_0197334212 /NCGR_PEP_ID=MMETSP0892-20130614/28524_1 /TAXON_ID=44058 ORGANISM="Aureoumbra lagunensis, Strain CCMP1510" /NCGR_SAMPLE_ID=MMETSP0892 /ASSEMBLY_ACC=CAM_ASM_000538 /LENGTH=406 /DNA_ID=CAMNT_0042834629 /DNA_START=55 /DNA_END=1275 /DNA_ORIENTATION=+